MPETDTEQPKSPAERAAEIQAQGRERRAKVGVQPGDQSKLPRPAANQKVMVDIEREQAVTVLYSTVVFRPNQVLKDARLIQIAEENGIPLRYKD